MISFFSNVITILLSAAIVSADDSPYVPTTTTCPSNTSLVRVASGIGESEDTYRTSRKAVADDALKSWLAGISPDFDINGSLPTLGFTVSGGGYRSMLTGAGVIQGLDARDSNVSTSGLWQAMTYASALSGGGWLLSSLASHNFATVSEVKESLWKEALDDTLLLPGGNVFNLLQLAAEVNDKEDAEFETTLTDLWGRALSIQLVPGEDAGADVTMSGLLDLPSFANSTAPIPIITAMGVNSKDGECTPKANGTIWEVSPFEFGSRMPDINAFVPTKLLGSGLHKGRGATGDAGCVTGFDNLGFLLGTSSSLFNFACLPAEEQDGVAGLMKAVSVLEELVHGATSKEQFAVYPNPFAGVDFDAATLVGENGNNPNLATEKQLFLADGGEEGHNVPIVPLLAPERNVSVLFVSDNTNDKENFPTGSQLINQAEIAAQNSQLSGRMPGVPAAKEEFADGGGRALFLGCEEKEAVTIVYLPNANFVAEAASNRSTAQIEYKGEETNLMIENGLQIATQGGDEEWGLCVACVIMKKEAEGKLPNGCDECFEKYCA